MSEPKITICEPGPGLKNWPYAPERSCDPATRRLSYGMPPLPVETWKSIGFEGCPINKPAEKKERCKHFFELKGKSRVCKFCGMTVGITGGRKWVKKQGR